MEFNIDVESDDYIETKRRYLELMKDNKEWLQKTYICTTEQIQTKIKELAEKDNKVANFEDGKSKLCVKVSPSVSKEVLSIEDAFEAILRAHVQCSHGDTFATHQVLSKQYSVQMFCVDALIDSCTVCIKRNTLKPNCEVRRGVWRMNIIKDEKVLKVLDHSRASHLLILKEDATNFVILRALYPSIQEVAFELMRIFVEFDYPKKIVVINDLDFYLKVMKIVHDINPVPDMPVMALSDNEEVFVRDKSEVLYEIEDWATMEDGCHWDQYCHMVQYKMNTKNKDLIRLKPWQRGTGIPFNRFFRYEPNSESPNSPNFW